MRAYFLLGVLASSLPNIVLQWGDVCATFHLVALWLLGPIV